MENSKPTGMWQKKSGWLGEGELHRQQLSHVWVQEPQCSFCKQPAPGGGAVGGGPHPEQPRSALAKALRAGSGTPQGTLAPAVSGWRQLSVAGAM